MAKKRSDHDRAFQALQNLMSAPGDPLEPFNDLLGNYGPDHIKISIVASAAVPQYTDRDAALVYGAMIEYALEIAISTKLIDDRDATSKLFSYADDGPLASFQAKIDISRALGIVGPKMRKDLWRLKAIRNAFAHARVGLHFNTPQIAEACAFLEISRGLVEQLTGPRQRFTLAIILLSTYLRDLPNLSPDRRRETYSSLYDEPFPSSDR